MFQPRTARPLALALAALAAPTAALLGVPTSADHSVLQRALAVPGADLNGDGVLTLEEYTAFLGQPRPNDPAQPVPAPFLPVLPNGEVAVLDFDEVSQQAAAGWTREGDAFPADLSNGTRLMSKRVGPFEGKLFLSTLAPYDSATGRLLSPPFLVEQDFLRITMSGGHFPQVVGVRLLVDDVVVRNATGRNDDRFEAVAFDLREFRGRLARLELLDASSDLWGHLNLDRIVLTNSLGDARIVDALPAPAEPAGGLALTTTGIVRARLRSAEQGLQPEHPGGPPAPPIPAEQLLLALNAPAISAPGATPTPTAVRLRNGEVWRVEFGELKGGTLAINSPLTGPRQLPLDSLASLDFTPIEPSTPLEPGRLYRTNGDPIPGSLVWLRQKDIAIDCALGVVPVPRPLVQHFVFATPTPDPARRSDEITLADRTRFFGTVSFHPDHLVLRHDLLGDLRLPWNEVRTLRRSPVGVTWLASRPFKILDHRGPGLPPPAPAFLPAAQPAGLEMLRIHPRTTVQWSRAAATGSPARLAGQLAPAPASRADLRVTIRDAVAVRWQATIHPGDDLLPLPADLFLSGDITIEVDFAGPFAFPAALDIRDPHLIAAVAPPEPTPNN